MNSSKFLFSTLIAAAAMTATAYATTLDDAVFSVDSFTQDLVTSLGISGNVQGGVYTTGSGNVSIAKDKIDEVLTTNVQEGSTDRYTYSAIITVDASVFSKSGNGLIIGGGNSTVGAAYNGGDLYGAWGNEYWNNGNNKSLDVSVTEGKITLGLVYTGGNSSGTKLYLLGQETQLIDSLKGSSDVSAIVLGGGISYSNLYWFNSALSSTDMQRNMSVVSGNTYRWAGTADGKWSDATWESAGKIGSFVAEKDVLFDASTAVSKTIMIDSAVTAGSMTVASDYVFNIGSTGSLAANSIVIDNCVATLNLDSDKSLSSAVSGAGTLKKTGTGTLTFSGGVEQGATVEVASGTMNIAGGSQTFLGNLTVGSDATVHSEVTDSIPWGGGNHEQIVKVLGTLDLDARWSLNTNKKLVMAGGTVTGTGATNNADHNGVALDFFSGGIVTGEANTDSSIEAGIRIGGGRTLRFTVGENGTLSVGKIFAGSNVNISSSATIRKEGTGTLKLTSALATNYSGGGIVVDAGTLEVAVAPDATFTQVGTITTTGEGKITVSSGKLALTGAVNLSNAIENSGKVTVANTAVFALAGLNGVEGNSGTTYTLVSGMGATTFEDGMGVANVNLAGTNFIGRDASAIFSSGTVTVTGGTAGNIIWAGANNNNTWDNATSSNWKVSSSDDSPTKFYNLDNVTFDGTAANNTVALVSGETVSVGTMDVSGVEECTLTTSHNQTSPSRIEGSELSISSGATLNLSTELSGATQARIELDFENINLSGVLRVRTNSTDSWRKLTMAASGANLHLHDIGGDYNTTGLTISSLVVSEGESRITAKWGGKVLIESLSGSGTLNIERPASEQMQFVVSDMSTYSGTLSIGSNSGSNLQTTLNGKVGDSAKVKVANSSLIINTDKSGDGTVGFAGDLTIGNGATVSFGGEDKFAFNKELTVTVKEGGTLDFGGYRQTFGTKNVLVLAGGTLTGSGDQHGALDFMGDHTIDVSANSTISANVRLRSGTATFDVIGADTSLEISGALMKSPSVADTGALKKTGAGTLMLSGNNTYTGGTTISQGKLVAASANALGSGTLTLNGGTFGTSLESMEIANAVTLGEGTTSTINLGQYTNGAFNTSESVSKITIANAISGEGSLTVVGNLNAGDSNNRQLLTLSGNNNYTGNTTLNGAYVSAESSTALGVGTLTMNGAQVQINTGSLTVKNLNGDGRILLGSDVTNSVLTVETTENSEFAGNLSTGGYNDGKTLDLIKTEAGTLTLTGSLGLNAVTVVEGTLSIVGSETQLTSDVTLASDTAKLQLGVTKYDDTYYGGVFIGGNLNLAKDSELVVDVSNVEVAGDTITLNIVSATAINLNWTGSETMTLSSEDSSVYGEYVSLTGNKELLETYVNQTWSYANGTLYLTLAIPEPSLFGLLAGLGALTLVGTRRRRGKKA